MTEKQAPYGKVRVLAKGPLGWRVLYLSGPLRGREARIPGEYLK